MMAARLVTSYVTLVGTLVINMSVTVKMSQMKIAVKNLKREKCLLINSDHMYMCFFCGGVRQNPLVFRLQSDLLYQSWMIGKRVEHWWKNN
jgi:hypothetical protein